MHYLGIDGGGTKTVFALADERGNIIRQAALGPTNPVDVGMDTALTRIGEGIAQVSGDVPLCEVSVFAGIAGGITGNNQAMIKTYLDTLGFAYADNGSDAQSIVAAGLGKRDGIVVIMGTGSATFVQKDGALIRLGGYGYLFDEGGSGYALGRDAIMASLAAEEGSAEHTLLQPLLSEQLKMPTVLGALSALYEGGKRQIASYAPLVFRAYERGDAVAGEILRRHMACVARSLCTAKEKLQASASARVVLAGGLTAQADILIPMIKRRLDDERMYDIAVLSKTPVMGALLLAGMPTEEK